jgi:hypothetical protein
LIDDFNKAKARLEKELKQQEMACGKCKADDSVSITMEIEGKINESDSGNVHSELEQLTLTDVSKGELENSTSAKSNRKLVE